MSNEKRFVSRAGQKLDHALGEFGIEVWDLVAAGLGCNAGGFTDCLLAGKAAKVFAIDTGYGVLDWKLRKDPRVVVMDGVNARQLDAASFPERPAFATIDAAFISLKLLLPAVGGGAPRPRPPGAPPTTRGAETRVRRTQSLDVLSSYLALAGSSDLDS